MPEVREASNGRFFIVGDGGIADPRRFDTREAAERVMSEPGFVPGGGGGGRQRGGGRMADGRVTTPSRPTGERAAPSLAMRIDSRTVIEFTPHDKAAMAMAMLLAMRSTNAGVRGEQSEYVTLLARWLTPKDAPGSNLPNIESAVTFFMELFDAIPIVARAVGFSADEWCRTWNAVAGEVAGILPVGPPVSISDGPFPPVTRATVTTEFGPGHNGVDLAVAYGTPVLAPEDLEITAVKTATDFGNMVVGQSRRSTDGKFASELISRELLERMSAPGTLGGTFEKALRERVLEGTRQHTFGHLATWAPGLKAGDRVERGATIGTVGGTGTASKGVHLHWRVELYAKTVDGLDVDLFPMDPLDFVPREVITAGAPVRAPLTSWTLLDKKAPEGKGAREVPSYNIYVGGNLVYKGAVTEVEVGDILSPGAAAPPAAPTEERTVATILGRGAGQILGGAIGAFAGGPLGARAGAGVGGAVGEGGARLGEDLFSTFGGGRRRT